MEKGKIGTYQKGKRTVIKGGSSFWPREGGGAGADPEFLRGGGPIFFFLLPKI